MLETYIRAKLARKDILLMTHIVLGYPSFEDNLRTIECMVDAGVDLMELQIPFSEPVADGPVILRANQMSLAMGTSVRECLAFADRVTSAFDIPFLIMSYYNIVFKYGIAEFVAALSERNLRGTIIPDLPPEEGEDFLMLMHKHHLAPIFIFTPTTAEERMRYIASLAEGFLYCVARKGVTGSRTRFSEELASYLKHCRQATDRFLAVGFGLSQKADVEYLNGKADIAVVGSQAIRIMEQEGISAVGNFIRTLH